LGGVPKNILGTLIALAISAPKKDDGANIDAKFPFQVLSVISKIILSIFLDMICLN
jgi:hypothetical protein